MIALFLLVFFPCQWPDVCTHEVVTLNIHNDDVSGSPGRHQRPAAVGGLRFPLCWLACMLLPWWDAPSLVWLWMCTNALGWIGFVVRRRQNPFLAFSLSLKSSSPNKSTTNQQSSFVIFPLQTLSLSCAHSHAFFFS